MLHLRPWARYLRKQLPGYRRSRRAFSSLTAPGPLRLHDFVSRLDQKRVSPLGVGVSTVSGSGTTVNDLHSVQLTVPGSLEQVRARVLTDRARTAQTVIREV